VLVSPIYADALGERWGRGVRQRLLARDGVAEEIALWAGGPVALAKALGDLNRS
jgi:hypothetical protein